MSDSAQTFSPEDEKILNKTQAIREKIVDKLTFGANPVPEDGDEKRLLMQALDGMDKQILMKTKIKSDDQGQKTQQQTATIIAELLLKTNKSIITAPIDNSARLLQDTRSTDSFIQGHLDTGHVQVDPQEILNSDN